MIHDFTIKFIGGRGGHGVVRFTSLFAKQYAGPDGGDGGNGGHVVLRANPSVTSLQHLDQKPYVGAVDGEKGDR